MKRGIDVGNYSLKECPDINIKSLISTETNRIITPLNEDEGNDLVSKSLCIEYDNQKLFIGEGKFETEPVKTSKDNFLPLLYTALAMKVPELGIPQQIVVGLPISQYIDIEQRKELKDKILNNKIKDVIFNGKPKRIIIDEFEIYPEGIGAYYSLNTDEDCILIDIGGLTTDIAFISNKKLKEHSTILVGTLNIYKDIADKLNNKYSKYGLNLDIEDAERIFDKREILIDNEKIDLEFMKNIVRDNFNKINDDLNLKYHLRNNVPIVIVGGGHKIFSKAFQNRYKNCQVADNPIYANAIGFRKVADKLWGQKTFRI